MAGNNVFNNNDSMDINELASLNDDISPELIEQLQQKLSQDAQILNNEPQNQTTSMFDEKDDSTLFEEFLSEDSSKNDVSVEAESTNEKKQIKLDKNIDDNFIKKYKAKLNKQNLQVDKSDSSIDTNENTISNAAFTGVSQKDDIENLSNGNISEKPLTPDIKNYNDSLDLLDGNVKYSKYVIYIEPQNVDFIDSLTVKERKNLINKILKEQNDIAITRQRFRMVQAVIKHAVVAILTIAISVPIIYVTINASLEASINNYRRSQSMFQTLYKQGGKIKANY